MTASDSSPASTPSVKTKVALVNGCFDLFHPGHARFLWEAKKRCTYLIVAVNDDASVRQLKGPTRPFDALRYRMDKVSQYADQVIPFDGNVEELINDVRPDVVIRGWDQALDTRRDVIVLPRFVDISTTEIANG